MSSANAQIFLDTNRTIAPISPWLFGGFVEHMGRCVYEGIYDPESPLAGLNITKKWTMPIQTWANRLNQLAIRFEGRFRI